MKTEETSLHLHIYVHTYFGSVFQSFFLWMGERVVVMGGVDDYWKARFGASIDRLLDSSPLFSSSIRQAFREYQQPPPPSQPTLPRQLLTQQSNNPHSLASSSSIHTIIPMLPPNISLFLALKLVLQASLLSCFPLPLHIYKL